MPEAIYPMPESDTFEFKRLAELDGYADKTVFECAGPGGCGAVVINRKSHTIFHTMNELALLKLQRHAMAVALVTGVGMDSAMDAGS
jgi:hypothetical protein